MNALKEVIDKPNPAGKPGVDLPANLSLTQERFNALLRNNQKKLGLILFAYLNRHPAPMEEKLGKVASLIVNSPTDEESMGWKKTLIKNLPIEERAGILERLRRAGAEAEDLAQAAYDEAVSPQLKKVFDELGGDSDGDGIISSTDKGWKTYGQAYDRDGNGYLDYTEIPIAGNEKPIRISMAKDLYNNLLRQLSVGHNINPHHLKQLEALAGRYHELLPDLADIKAHLHIRQGNFTLALQEYQAAETALGKNIGSRFDVYNNLLKHKSQLSFLENLAAVLPRLAGSKLFKQFPEELGELFEFAFIKPGNLTLKKAGVIIKYLDVHSAELPKQAQELKSQLIAFQKTAAAKIWETTVGGAKLKGQLSNQQVGDEIEILAPKTLENEYTVGISFGKQKKFYFDLKGGATVTSNKDNPLLVKIKIPVWKILSVVPPGARFNLELNGNMEKTVKLYPLTRSEQGFSGSKIPMATWEAFRAHALRLAQSKGELQVRYVVLSHVDHPEQRLELRDEKFDYMISALRIYPHLFPELTANDRTELMAELKKKRPDFSNIEKDRSGLRAAKARLLGISDMYFTEGGGVYAVLRREPGWRLIKAEEPPKKEGDSPDGLVVISPRYVMHLEKTVTIKGKKVALKMRVEHYTHTQNGYESAIRSLSDPDVSMVMVQGHRWKKTSVHLNGLPPFPGRETPVAYLANHCESWEGDVAPMAAYIRNIYSPAATYNSVFPSAKVNLAFLNGVIDGLSSGNKFDSRIAREAYQRANPKSSGPVWGGTEKYAGYNRSIDSDGDGLPDFIDPDPGEKNRFAYDREKRELHIETGGRIITLKNYADPSEQLLRNCVSLKELRSSVRKA